MESFAITDIGNRREINQDYIYCNDDDFEEEKTEAAEEVKEAEEFSVEVAAADGEKCERCWMYSCTVGEDKENPTICKKCSENLK